MVLFPLLRFARLRQLSSSVGIRRHKLGAKFHTLCAFSPVTPIVTNISLKEIARLGFRSNNQHSASWSRHFLSHIVFPSRYHTFHHSAYLVFISLVHFFRIS